MPIYKELYKRDSSYYLKKTRAKAGRSRILKTRIIDEREDYTLKDLLNLKINNNKIIATFISIYKSLYK
jgi:predicted transcriptional regulator